MSGVRTGFARLAREPLVHFFVAGLLLFLLVQHHRAQTDLYRIVVTPERVRQLTAGYHAEYGAQPTPQALSQLIDHDVDLEVLYREGLARKLDRDDEIVRRRVVQKMQFLQQDTAPVAEPSEERLQAYYRAHAAQYARASGVSFSHVYLSDEHGGAAAGRQRALTILASLSNATTRAPERGDAFPDLYDYAGLTPEQARRLFGDSELSRRLFDAPPDRWSGPFRSTYGWHLVRVQSQTPSQVPPFAAVREQVRADLIAADQDAANRKSFETLKARFTVVRADGPSRP